MILVRIFFTLLLIGPIILGVINFIKYRKEPALNNGSYYVALINSAVIYAIAYNVIYFVQELFLVVGKNSLGLTAYLYHNNHSWDGEHPMTSLMQGSGALAIFLAGLIFLTGLIAVRHSTSIWKVLLLWLSFQGLIQSIPQIMIGYFDSNTDVGQALTGYLNINQNLFVMLSIFSIFATVAISIYFCRILLEMAPINVELDSARTKSSYIRFVTVGAALLGCILIVPFKIFPLGQAIGPVLLLLFSIPWIWAAAARTKEVKSFPNDLNEKIRWEPILVLATLLLFFRLVLAPGIVFVA